MKQDTHPTYYLDAKVHCACGNSWTTGSTKEELSLSICSQCHPFYSGEEKIVDTRGRVERFKKRLEKTAEASLARKKTSAKPKKAKKAKKEKKK